MHRPQDIEKVLRKYPVEDVWGIGRRSASKLHERYVRTAYDFVCLPEEAVRKMMGVTGVRTWRELQGIPCIEFEDGFDAKQSICVSRSFSTEIYDCGELREQIANFASAVARKLRKQNSLTGEIAVFAYTNRFKEDQPQTHASFLVSFPSPTSEQREIVIAAASAVKELFHEGYGYKKAGVIATRIMSRNDAVRSIFEDTEASEKEHRITSALDAINRTYGEGTLKLAVQGSGKIRSTSEKQSPHYTTKWNDIPKVSIK